jgi:hypothetical protein
MVAAFVFALIAFEAMRAGRSKHTSKPKTWSFASEVQTSPAREEF